MTRQQRRYQERMKKKGQSYNTNSDDFDHYFSSGWETLQSPETFFSSLPTDIRKSLQEKMKMETGTDCYTAIGEETNITTRIGWNPEKEGYYLLRSYENVPKEQKDVLDSFGMMIIKGMEYPSNYHNGDGVSTWCIPPQNIIDEYMGGETLVESMVGSLY